MLRRLDGGSPEAIGLLGEDAISVGGMAGLQSMVAKP
jgi:hypothetical protein